MPPPGRRPLRFALLALPLVAAACARSDWPASVTVGGAGPMRGTMTGDDVLAARERRTRLERLPDPAR